MSEHAEKWQTLTQDWADSLKKAKMHQSIIDDKMHSFLNGNGCLPTKEELTQVESLWEQHVQARNRTNQYIRVVIAGIAA